MMCVEAGQLASMLKGLQYSGCICSSHRHSINVSGHQDLSRLWLRHEADSDLAFIACGAAGLAELEPAIRSKFLIVLTLLALPNFTQAHLPSTPNLGPACTCGCLSKAFRMQDIGHLAKPAATSLTAVRLPHSVLFMLWAHTALFYLPAMFCVLIDKLLDNAVRWHAFLLSQHQRQGLAAVPAVL